MGNKAITFEPKRWHSCTEADWQNCDKASNCYSYILDQPDYYWSQPGMGYVRTKPLPYFTSFNDFFKDFSLKDFMTFMLRGAVKDGLVRIPAGLNHDGYYTAALYFKEQPDNFDLHWFRQDDDGTWSHKDGWRSVSNLDDSGKIITDVSDAPLKEYSLFGSYFLVPRNGIHLEPVFPMD